MPGILVILWLDWQAKKTMDCEVNTKSFKNREHNFVQPLHSQELTPVAHGRDAGVMINATLL